MSCVYKYTIINQCNKKVTMFFIEKRQTCRSIEREKPQAQLQNN
jgi:hypothetical protein